MERKRKKLSPFRIGCTRRGFVGFGDVDKLKHKGSTGDNPLTRHAHVREMR